VVEEKGWDTHSPLLIRLPDIIKADEFAATDCIFIEHSLLKTPIFLRSTAGTGLTWLETLNLLLLLAPIIGDISILKTPHCYKDGIIRPALYLHHLYKKIMIRGKYCDYENIQVQKHLGRETSY